MADSSDQAQSLFLNALEIADDRERAAYIDAACGGDSQLRKDVEELLDHAQRLGRFLEAGEEQVNATIGPPITEKPGTQIGPYKLLQQVGEGGMGVVYLAEQTEPVERRVALKIIKPGMDSRQVIARFEAERQALAMMEHPNIAKVLDAGTTDTGRPYFVMELVKGVPITQYCDEKRLTPKERLELFVPVCQAVQHAHQKGIIHRDIKPSNVLVALYDDRPVPKMIDFGVAKATSQTLTEKTMFTQYGQIVGTLEYMSPEQAQLNQVDVDTRSDIYSLGVLLYELLVGETPFDRQRLRSAAFDELLRIICEEEPPTPSRRLSTSDTLPTTAANRHIEPKKLNTLVRGDLDWIVMKALEKDRARRYETASSFADDVRRYLADQPVHACPPSARYRLRKFARRNKGGLAVGVLVLFFLVLLGSSIGWAARDHAAQEQEAARERAARQARVSEQVALILTEVGRLEREQNWAEALAAAKRAEAAVAGGEADAATAQRVHALVKALGFVDRLGQIRMERAKVFGDRFDYVGTDREYARSFRDYGVNIEELAVEESVHRLKAQPQLAIPLAAALDDWVFARQRISEEDTAAWQRLVAVARGIDSDSLRDRLRSTWGEPVSEQMQDEMRRLTEMIDIRAQHPATIFCLVHALERVNNRGSALRILRDAQSAFPEDFWINLDLGNALARQEDHAGATRFFTAAVSLRPDSVAARFDLGLSLANQGNLDEAIACYRTVIELDPTDSGAYHSLGNAFKEKGQRDEAIAAYRKAIEIDPKAAGVHYNLGLILRNPDEAIACYRKAIEIDPELTLAYNALGGALQRQGRLDEAIAVYRKGTEVDPADAHSWNEMGYILRRQHKLDEAIAAFRKLIEVAPGAAAGGGYAGLGVTLRDQNKLDEAIAALRKARQLLPERTIFKSELVDTLSRKVCELANPSDAEAGDLERARELCQEAIEIDPKSVVSHYNLGNVLVHQNKLDEAIAAYRKAIEIDPKYENACRNLNELARRDQNKLDEVIAVYNVVITAEETTNPDLLKYRAAAYVLAGKWDLAKADWLRAVKAKPELTQVAFDICCKAERWSEAAEFGLLLVERRPSDAAPWLRVAPLLAVTDGAAYREFCVRMADQFARTKDPVQAEKTCKACLLLADSIDLGNLPADTLASYLDSAAEPRWLRPNAWAARALLAYRSGDAESVVKYVEQSQQDDPNPFIHALNLAVGALALKQLGRSDEAGQSLKAAAGLVNRLEQDPKNRGDLDLLMAQILLREAEELVGTAKPKTPGDDSKRASNEPGKSLHPTNEATSPGSPRRDQNGN